MYVKHLQEFLEKFTSANKADTRQGNAVSNAKIYIERNGRLHEIKRIEAYANVFHEVLLKIISKAKDNVKKDTSPETKLQLVLQ